MRSVSSESLAGQAVKSTPQLVVRNNSDHAAVAPSRISRNKSAPDPGVTQAAAAAGTGSTSTLVTKNGKSLESPITSLGSASTLVTKNGKFLEFSAAASKNVATPSTASTSAPRGSDFGGGFDGGFNFLADDEAGGGGGFAFDAAADSAGGGFGFDFGGGEEDKDFNFDFGGGNTGFDF